MKIRNMFVGLVLTLALAAGAAAQDPSPQARIDAKAATSGAKLEILAKPEGGSGARATWPKTDEEKDRTLSFRLTAPKSQWREMKFSFQSDTDTRVTLAFTGRWHKDADGKMVDIFNYFDSISVEGMELSNASFEESRVNTETSAVELAGWTPTNSKKSPEIVKDASLAHDGEQVLKVSNSNGFRRTINVKAGEPVVVTAWIRGAE